MRSGMSEALKKSYHGFYLLVKRNSVMSEKINAMNNKIRYPKNSVLVPVRKKPMIMMITTAHMPAIIKCLLSI